MSTFSRLIERMASAGNDWNALDEEDRLEAVLAHMNDVADEYSSEAVSPDAIRKLAPYVAKLDYWTVGRLFTDLCGDYALKCTQNAVHHAMGTPASLRRQA